MGDCTPDIEPPQEASEGFVLFADKNDNTEPSKSILKEIDVIKGEFEIVSGKEIFVPGQAVISGRWVTPADCDKSIVGLIKIKIKGSEKNKMICFNTGIYFL